MNENDFKTLTSTVIATNPGEAGTEIWVRYDDGREASYQVADPSFRCRENQQLTAILRGAHPILLRNDSTGMKIQLHSGEDILGSGPQVEPMAASFWLAWAVCILCPPIGILFLLGAVVGFVWDDVMLPIKVLIAFIRKQWRGILVAGIILVIVSFFIPATNFLWLSAVLAYVAIIFGVPYACIIRPRIRRARHQGQIKAADAVITRLFNQL